ncbi:MAG TPA: TMEM175 family protein [Rubricoccaceae bacterium]|jgi:uncharacterized membrane protein
MTTSRIEAFSDGVLAIIITIMVLELPVPHEPTLAALRPALPVFLSYVLSFIYVGIYWNNHHHLFQASDRIDGRAMWANLHLLFWLSVVPFVTAWSGETAFAPVPVAFYGVVLLMNGIAFAVLEGALHAVPGGNPTLDRAMGRRWREKASVVLYALSIPLALYVHPAMAGAIYVGVAIVWLLPDRRIESVLTQSEAERR